MWLVVFCCICDCKCCHADAVLCSLLLSCCRRASVECVFVGLCRVDLLYALVVGVDVSLRVFLR